MAEQVTVNHLVAGSIPARAAIPINEMRYFMILRKIVLGHFLATLGVLNHALPLPPVWGQSDRHNSPDQNCAALLAGGISHGPSVLSAAPDTPRSCHPTPALLPGLKTAYPSHKFCPKNSGAAEQEAHQAWAVGFEAGGGVGQVV